ncbi:hypothetical protein [Prescottella agglutinans]|uniref:Recombinase n=1 Tax=Prescottella agglutinans TaxID=1644129 RepID=A0ABT6MJW1_9NOCA|nr:hypothetical protein [Prescottella agglutinans]MDH6284608.1 hypothetical protein [Prescottella agglutinans]
MQHDSSPTAAATAPRGYQYDWQLFADWCAAIEEPSLPADPLTVALFLDENPAALGTQRVRVTAINGMHKRYGYPAPGTARAIRERLTRRTRPRPDRQDAARRVVAMLPTTGWPAGLFGRRDALILVLSCYLDLSPTEIGRLRRTDVTFDGQAVHIAGGHDITVPADLDDPRGGAVPAYLRWARLQAYNDRYPSNRMLAESLIASAPVTDDTVVGAQRLPQVRYDGPLIPAFDRWGHAPLGRAGMSRHAVAKVVSAHLAGTATRRADRTVKHFDDGWTDAVEDVTTAAYSEMADGDFNTNAVPEIVEYTSEELAAKYDAGIAARKAGAAAMADFDDAFDEIDARTAELLARTEALLEQMSSGTGS